MLDYDYTNDASQVEWTDIDDELTDVEKIAEDISEAEQWQEHMDSLGEYATAVLEYCSSKDDDDED